MVSSSALARAAAFFFAGWKPHRAGHTALCLPALYWITQLMGAAFWWLFTLSRQLDPLADAMCRTGCSG